MSMETLVILILLTSYLVITGLPAFFVWAVVERPRHRNLTPLFVLCSTACGFAVGLAVAWSYVIFHEGWHLSIIETIDACFHADIYGGAIEGSAEDYFIFTLFLGDIGAILAGVAGWLSARHRRRAAVSS